MSSTSVVRGWAAVRWLPLRLMVTSYRLRSSRKILAILILVVFWMWRATAREAITTVR